MNEGVHVRLGHILDTLWRSHFGAEMFVPGRSGPITVEKAIAGIRDSGSSAQKQAAKDAVLAMIEPLLQESGMMSMEEFEEHQVTYKKVVGKDGGTGDDFDPERYLPSAYQNIPGGKRQFWMDAAGAKYDAQEKDRGR